jgi:hypothetical protein
MKYMIKIRHTVTYHLFQAFRLTKARTYNDLSKYYQNGEKSLFCGKTTLVVMIDGKVRHGGLADRLKGIVSIYDYAMKHDYDFRIFHNFPFELSDYLEPNLYDWRINVNELSFNSQHAQPFFIESLGYFKEGITQKRVLDRYIINDRRQYHIYTNIDLCKDQYSLRFDELFKPSLKLQNSIENYSKQFSRSYIAMVFRFQQLLGDFEEGNYPILAFSDQLNLMEKCKNKIKSIQQQLPNGQKVLVTSDSQKFLASLEGIKDIYTIPGEVVHIDYTDNATEDVYIKSFIDLFMLSRASTIFLLSTGQMYKSDFARCASLVKQANYYEIEF